MREKNLLSKISMAPILQGTRWVQSFLNEGNIYESESEIKKTSLYLSHFQQDVDCWGPHTRNLELKWKRKLPTLAHFQLKLSSKKNDGQLLHASRIRHGCSWTQRSSTLPWPQCLLDSKRLARSKMGLLKRTTSRSLSLLAQEALFAYGSRNQRMGEVL